MYVVYFTYENRGFEVWSHWFVTSRPSDEFVLGYEPECNESYWMVPGTEN